STRWTSTSGRSACGTGATRRFYTLGARIERSSPPGEGAGESSIPDRTSVRSPLCVELIRQRIAQSLARIAPGRGLLNLAVRAEPWLPVRPQLAHVGPVNDVEQRFARHAHLHQRAQREIEQIDH